LALLGIAQCISNVVSFGDSQFNQLGRGAQQNFFAQPGALQTGDNVNSVIAVAAGANHTLFLLSNRAVFGVGRNSESQLGVNQTFPVALTPFRLSNPASGLYVISAIAVGNQVSRILTATGKVLSFGSTNVATGEYLGNEATISTSVPIPLLDPFNVIGNKNIKSIAVSGAGHTLMVSADGSLFAFGRNNYCQLGLQICSGDSQYPRRVFDGYNAINNMNIADIAVGSEISAARSINGTVFFWGNGAYGALGTGGISNGSIPFPKTSNLLAGKTVTQVSMSNSFTVLVTADGQGYGFGRSEWGNLCDGATAQQQNSLTPFSSATFSSKTITSVVASNQHTLVLTSDGSVFKCGSAYSGAPVDATITLVLKSPSVTFIAASNFGSDTSFIGTSIDANATVAPVPTLPPVVNNEVSKITQKITGAADKLPPAAVPGSSVLFSNASVKASLPISFTTQQVIPKTAIVQASRLTFNVTYVSAAAVVAVVVSDQNGTVAGSVSVSVTAKGTYTVDFKDILTELLLTYQQSFTIRAIRGNILSVSVESQTDDVVINIDENVSTTVTYADTSSDTATPTPSTGATTTTIPVSTKSSASQSTSYLLVLLILFFLEL
jgi:alpha-tubulin suppressor-like RCC1 family protein